MGRFDPDPEALDLPANRQVLATLARSAQPARSEYRRGAFEQLTHPDVCERLDQVAGGGQPVGAYGRCARSGHDGTLYAIGLGTSMIALRLPEGPAQEAVLANGGRLDPDLGSNWVLANAWLSDVPRADGTALLTSWLELARVASGA
jgi:hypothetical protein